MIWSVTCPNCGTVVVCDETHDVGDVVQCVGCMALMQVVPKDKTPLGVKSAAIERLT